MSLTSMVNIALSGIFTSQQAMRTTSNNIANVNTDGYQRQILRQENQVVGGESFGVRVASVERIVDRFLSSAGLSATSDAEAATVQREFHDRLQGVIGRPESGTTIAARIDQVFGSFAELSLNPADRIVRQASLESITDLTIEISRLAQNIQDLRNDASQRISEEILSVNDALKRVHELNPIIVRQKALGAETAGLETQRDQAIAEVAKSLDVKTITQDDGLVTLSTGSGVTLVDLALRELEYVAPGVVTSDTRFAPIRLHRLDSFSGERSGSVQDLNGNINGGVIRGLLDLRDGDLKNLSLSLGEFSATFMEEVNRVHNSFSSFPAANTLTGSTTALAGTHDPNFTGKVTFAVTDSAGKVVSETLVDFDSAAPASITALVAQVNAGLGGNGTMAFTNGVMSLKATNAANGVVIRDNDTTPSDRAGYGFSQFFGMNDLISAKVTGNYDTGFSGTDNHNLVAGGQTSFELRDKNGSVLKSYTMSVAGTTINDQIANLQATGALGTYLNLSLDSSTGKLNITEKAGFNNLELSVLSDTTNFNSSGISFTELFGIGDRYRVEASRNMQVKEDILLNPEKMSLASYDLSAGVGNVSLSRGDQSGALKLHALQNGLFGFEAAGEMSNITVSMSQYSSAMLANTGLMASRAQNREEDAMALKIEIDQRQADISGVNLDEELSQMIILQTSFNAAARLLTTADEMMDILIQSV